MAGVRVEVGGGVYWVVLSRPERLNSLDSATLASVEGALGESCGRGDVAVVALTGEGRFFSSGIDLAEVASAAGPGEASRPFKALAGVLGAMLSCPKPVVAVLNGPAVAGGAELAVAADLVYAVRGSWLQWVEARWGLVPPVLASLSIPEQVKARLALAAERVSAEEALRYGIIAGVYGSVEEARGAVEALARLAGEAGPEALGAILEAVRRPKRGALALAEKLVGLAESEALIARAKAFLERRRG